MIDARQIAAGIVGAVDCQTEVSGFCHCPGEALHTHATGRKDCRVNVDGAPTIYCFHSSCAPAVTATNRRLRRELNASPWALTLPDGSILRSGDILQPDGKVRTRAAIEGRTASGLRPPSPQSGDGERMVLATIRTLAERFKPELFENFRWPFAQIVEDSPLLVAERDAEDQFRTWLKLWPAHCHVWIGDVFSSGKPHPITGSRVVLTVAHVFDERPEAASLLNLAALCQRCHNRHDAPGRQLRRKARTEARTGQRVLFPETKDFR